MSRYTYLGLSIFLFSTPTVSEILKINAQQVESNNSTVVAEGNVTVHYKEFTLKADKVIYNKQKQTVEAEGNLFITDNSAIFLKAKKGTYYLTTNEVDLFFPSGKVKDVYLNALFAKYVNGTLTLRKACASKCKDFQAEVCAKKFIYLQKEGDGTAYSGTLKVEKIPVLYTPYYHFTTKRKSGLLPPILGFDSYKEFIYQQPVYFVLDEHSDITLIPDYRTGGLKGLGTEFRKFFNYNTYLETRNYFYYDTAYPGKWWEGRNYHRKNRFLLSGEGYSGKLTFGWEYPSDKDFYYDVFFNKNKLRYKSFAKSYIDYLLENKSFLLNLRTVYFENLLTTNRKADLALAPDLFVYKKPSTIGNHFSWDFLTEATNFYKNSTSFVRVRWEANLRWNYILGTTPVEMEFKPFANYYSSKRYGNVHSFAGAQFRTSALIYDLDLVRTKNYLWQSVWETEYKLQPFKEKPTPTFDYFDLFSRKNIALLRNLNRVFYKELQVAEITIEQPYNFYSGYNFPTDGYFVKKHLMPLKVFYNLGHRKLGATLDGKIYYDHNFKSIFYQSNTLNLYLVDTEFIKWTLKAGYVLSKDHRGKRYAEQYKGGSHFTYRKLHLKGDVYYDKKLEKITSEQFSVEYRKKCWSLALNYSRDYNRDSKDYTWQVFLTLNVFGKALNALLAGGRK